MVMIRVRLDEALKAAMLARDQQTVSTVRLILAALKDRDIAERGRGNTDGLSDSEILSLLQSMIKQREESARLYQQGGRNELAAEETAEIGIIRQFLPVQLSEEEVAAIVDAVVSEIGAESLKEMGKVMGVLKERYAGSMNFTRASTLVKNRLS